MASVLSGRYSAAIGDLSASDFSGDPYAALWRGIAFARTSRWENARADFTVGESAADALDNETRAMARVTMAQAALDAGDFATADAHLNRLPFEIQERRWAQEALLAKGFVYAMFTFGLIIAVQQLEAHVLQPLVMGRAVSIHPLAIVLAISTGAVLAGITGALLAVPVLAFLNSAIRVLAAPDPAAEAAELETSEDPVIMAAQPDTPPGGHTGGRGE